jgi:stage IV sporulation protein FB
MGWSIPVGTVKGTVVRIHFTFLLFLVWIAVSHYARGGRDAAVEGTIFVILLFLCVLLHEFGHVFAARRYGVQTPDITLLPIGGVARLERIPEEPSQELIIALAGPAVNVVIAAILFVALGGFLPPESVDVQNPGTSMLARLAMVNLFLVVFNMIPAFPMDGGRVLRALLAARYGYQRGTQIAATVGQVLAFGLGLLGLMGNPILVFIAIFVYLGAAGEAHAVQMRQASRGMLASDAMITRFESLRPGSTVEDAVQCLIHTTQHDFPIVDGAGMLRGVLTRDDMIRALRDQGPTTSVMEIMRGNIPVIHQRQPLEKALQLMQKSQMPAIGVTDSASRLVGLITPENVGEMMMVLAASPPRRTPMPWQRIAPSDKKD